MGAKSTPTITQLAKELNDLDKRVVPLEQWKVAEDAYRAALAQVKSEEKQARADAVTTEWSKRGIEIIKQVSIILGIVIAILYAWAAAKGIKAP